MQILRMERDKRPGGLLFDQPYLLLSLTSLFWAGNIVLGRAVVGHIPPVTLSVVRWAGAVVVLLPFAARHLIRDWPTIRKRAGILSFLALTGFSAYNTFAYYGLQYTTAIHGLLLQSVAPLFVALWTFVLFRDRLTLRQAGGILLSLIGVVVIICRGSPAVLTSFEFNQGDLWFIAALLIYAFYTAMLRRRPAIHPLSFLAIGMGVGALWLLPVMLLELLAGRTVTFDAETLGSFVYICIFPSLLGYLFLNRGIELIGANRAAPFIHLVPVFGSALAIALLGEHFYLYHAIGYALVFAGITLATKR